MQTKTRQQLISAFSVKKLCTFYTQVLVLVIGSWIKIDIGYPLR